MEQKLIILFYPKDAEKKKISNISFSILYLERMVRDLDIETILIDERINENFFQIIEKNRHRLLLVGVSAMIGYQIISGRAFSERVKGISGVPIIWGGWFATSFTEILLKESFVDFVICGQGEISFRKLVLSLIENKPIYNIDGLGYKSDGKIVINNCAEITDEKQFPLVDYKRLDINAIVNINGIISEPHRSINYIASLGCPHNCSFCCLASVWGRKFYTKDIPVIIQDIKYFVNEIKVNKIAFDDDNFFGNKRMVLEFCEQVIKNNLNFLWEGSAHPETFLKLYTDNDIETLCKAGCRIIRFGSESGDEEVLKKINKPMKPEVTLQVVKKLKEHKIKSVLYIMVAFPWNPDKDFKKTLNMVGKAKLIDSSLDAGINFFAPLPKTPLYPECLNYNYLPYTSFDGIVEFIQKDFTAPWWKKNYRKELYIFLRFYFKYSNIKHFRNKNGIIAIPAFFANIIFFPSSYLRLKFNWYKLPLDAYFYFSIKNMLKLFGNNKYDDDREAIARTRSWKR